MQGIVKWFNADKGFGFITSNAKEYFVYYKEIQADGFKNLVQGQNVDFDPDTSPKGAIARNVRVND